MAEELCSGCGAVAAHHPVVGVTRDEDGRMASFPVCDACWRDASHRTRVLKMHFFAPEEGPTAVQAAEENILVEPPPEGV